MRLLLFSNTTGYQLRSFNLAAERLGIELLFATDRCHQLDDPWQDRAIPVRFHDVEGSLAAIEREVARRPVDGVLAVGDRPVVLASRTAERLGLPWHSPSGAAASTNKRASRELIAGAGLPSPRMLPVDIREEARVIAPTVRYPCVIKPIGLSGSRGVMRIDDEPSFGEAWERLRRLLARPEIRRARSGLEDIVLVEDFIPGREFAVEGVLTRGVLTAFATFDKPDPLDGPFFEETIYVTPSRLEPPGVDAIERGIGAAARAIGLTHGPVHGECRVNDKGVFVLEVAARPIGGLCSKVLGFEGPDGVASLEHVLLEHAVGRSIRHYQRERCAAAVMMMPITKRGVFKEMTGEEQARRVPGIDDIVVTAKADQLLEQLPEAGSYLGFLFARAVDPAGAEQAVRQAYATLGFRIEREISVEH